MPSVGLDLLSPSISSKLTPFPVLECPLRRFRFPSLKQLDVTAPFFTILTI